MANKLERIGVVERKTNETEVYVNLNVDGQGSNEIETGIGFFNHLLQLFAVHGFFDLVIKAAGDLSVDCHHTVEDVGICLGKAFAAAVKEGKGINRYGHAYVPMDETLARVVVDWSKRPFLVFDAVLPSQVIGSFSTESVEEFLRAFAFNAGLTLHVTVLYGKNTHHIIEAIFKALGHAVAMATGLNKQVTSVLSTKGQF